MNQLQSNLDYYASQHTTKGCKITHMIGVPMITLSPLVSIFNKRLGRQLFSVGWGLQVIGHLVFERNQPVFLEVKNPITFLSALVFVGTQWSNIFSGKGLESDVKIETDLIEAEYT